MDTAFLAVDLGAESGRAVLGRFDGERITLEEVHRFANGPVRLPNGLHWDVLRIAREVKDGIAKASRNGNRIESLAVDTWGVDFALLDRDGCLISNPYHYRDPRTEGMDERAFDRMPKEEIYGTTGIQFMLLAHRRESLRVHHRQYHPALRRKFRRLGLGPYREDGLSQPHLRKNHPAWHAVGSFAAGGRRGDRSQGEIPDYGSCLPRYRLRCGRGACSE